MELLLIRHARPFPVTRSSGQADPPLNPEGQTQAQRLGAAVVAGRYGTVRRVVASPMQRAVATAEPISTPLGLETARDERLVELNHGWPEYGLAESAYVDRRLLLADMNAGRIAHRSFDPTGFQERVVAGIDELVDATDTVTAVVCHGGVINAYLSRLLGLSTMFFTNPYYTSVSRVLAEPDGYREVLSLNEVDHLR